MILSSRFSSLSLQMAKAGVSRVHQLIAQAKATFSLSKSEPKYLQELEKLKTIMSVLTPDDFNLNPDIAKKRWDYPSLSIFDAPSAFLDVYECEQFSVAIFLLKAKKQMPLHDHPGMFGLMKILFGSMVVTSYNRPKVMDTPPYRTFVSGSVVATPTSDVCILHENQGNLHEIEAQEETVAFLDILSPPYNPPEGRDCIYYTKQNLPVDKRKQKDSPERSVLLKPGSNPSWFSCIPQEYLGPVVK